MQFEIRKVLHLVPNERTVLQVHLRGQLAVLRVFAVPVQLALSPLVEQVARTGGASFQGLPEELALPLEGYRVRAGLEMNELPAILAAGVERLSGVDLPPPPAGHGHAYIATQWLEGEILQEVRGSIANKRATLLSLLDLLARLHDQNVVYGDLKPHNVVLVGGRPSLIDLDTLRRVAAVDVPVPTRSLTPNFAAPEQMQLRLTYLGSDVYSFAKVAQWLLEEELAADKPGRSLLAWQSMLSLCLEDRPAARPSSRELLGALRGDPRSDDGSHAHTLLGQGVGRSQRSVPPTEDTEFVADEPSGPALVFGTPTPEPFGTPAPQLTPPQPIGTPPPPVGTPSRFARRAAIVGVVAVALGGLALALGDESATTGLNRGQEDSGSSASLRDASGTRDETPGASEPDDPDSEDRNAEDFPFSSDPQREAIRIESRCGPSITNKGRPETLITCGITSTADYAETLRVTAILYPPGEQPIRSVKDHEVLPGQRAILRFRFPDIAIDSAPIRCRCDGFGL